MAKISKVNSKEGYGFLRLDEMQNKIYVHIAFQEVLRAGLVSVQDKKNLVRALNHMEQILIEALEGMY